QGESSRLQLGKRGVALGARLSQDESGHPRVGDPQFTTNVAALVDEDESLRLDDTEDAPGRGLAQSRDGDHRQQEAHADPSPPLVLPLQPVQAFGQDFERSLAHGALLRTFTERGYHGRAGRPCYITLPARETRFTGPAQTCLRRQTSNELPGKEQP